MLQYTGYLNTMIGILTPLLLSINPNAINPNVFHNEMMDELKNWEIEQNKTPADEVLNNTLMEYENGCDGSTVKEELLQLPSDGD